LQRQKAKHRQKAKSQGRKSKCKKSQGGAKARDGGTKGKNKDLIWFYEYAEIR
jgi:hypothetical protein